jgi:D-alanyl-lipoteichoic acid acyltransferase DltB (MBOAT superfamily)
VLFNSGIFFIFFALVYTAYLLLYRQLRWQNLLLLIASYIFYGSWNWRFLTLIIISTLVDFFIGQAMVQTSTDTPEGQIRRKRLLWLSVGINLGILGFYKYFNFFADSVVATLGYLGLEADPITHKIILPVGISFYTFQTMS